MREEGVQARGAYKEVPRASRRLALATPESPWDVHPCKGQNTPYTTRFLTLTKLMLEISNSRIIKSILFRSP
jgi:hypothetical protein